jgi:hypothetical protein
MADPTNLPSFGDFSIQDTMEMGQGNADLLANLISPETTTADPDEVKNIISEIEDPAPSPTKPTGKAIVQPVEGQQPTQKDLLSNFLLDSTDDDDKGDEPIKPEASKKNISDLPGDPDTPENDQVADQEGSNQFTSLSNDLFKLGVFSKEEDETDVVIKTPEEFLERFNSEKKKGAIEQVDNFIGQFGEDYRAAFDAIYVKGVDPKEYFGAYNNIVDFAEMDMSIESNQEAVLKQALTDQGFEAEDVTAEIERLRNYGDLESVSLRHHKVLIKKDTVRLQELSEKAERDLQNKQTVRNQYINNVQSILEDKLKTKEFDGIPLNPKLAGELQDFLLVDKWKTNSGETLTDFDKAILEMKRPENHAMKVKLGLLLKILEKDPTLSTIQKSATSKQVDSLFSEVAKHKSNVSGVARQAPATSAASWFKK